jgi:hypothetical protein
LPQVDMLGDLRLVRIRFNDRPDRVPQRLRVADRSIISRGPGSGM